MLDPRRLLTFREVARLGSFSRAAEELSLTQPAVSQQILSLERQLGIRLIDRGPAPAGWVSPRPAPSFCGTRIRSRAGCAWPLSSSALWWPSGADTWP